jgi:hypothetical protein
MIIRCLHSYQHGDLKPQHLFLCLHTL